MDSDTDAVTPEALRRRVDVPGTANFRDAAGGTGGTVAPGLLFRADGRADLGPAGRAAVERLGVRTVVDLREPIELRQHPDDLPDSVALHPVPLLEELEFDFEGAGLEGLYRGLLAERGPGIATAVATVCAADALPAVVHCTAGKDRTGITIALLLSVLGVDDETIADDYALTGELLRGEPMERIRRRAIESGLAEQVVATVMDAPRDAMVGTLRHLREDHGGAEAYLLAQGVAPEALERFRAAMAPPAVAA